ncbi:MAG: hypothetical protein HY670_07020 [Chloroflexi bacterium]|nr:hypothetical protein [Chloroflexota bacterium]
MFKKSGKERHEAVYRVTSLSSEQADPTRLLSAVLHQWPIENNIHGVHDVTLDKNRSQGRCSRIPFFMAFFTQQE